MTGRRAADRHFLLGLGLRFSLFGFLQPGSGERKEHTANASLAVVQPSEYLPMTIKTAVPAQAARRIQRRDYILPALVALAGASAAIAGADTTFDPALTQFTNFLEGSGGKIITVLSLAAGLIGLASGRFSLGQIAVPVGVGIGVGTGVPIVTSVVTAVI
jgi:hypothetical protein